LPVSNKNKVGLYILILLSICILIGSLFVIAGCYKEKDSIDSVFTHPPVVQTQKATISADDVNNDLPAWWFMPDKESYFPVAKVVDGDTIVVRIDGWHRKLRLIGIDAPESVHNDPQKNTPEGEEAYNFLNDLIAGQSVRLEYDIEYRDRFERDLCYCYLPDGTFINEAIVRAGHARLMTLPPNIKYVELLEAASRAAQKDKLGIWR